MKYIFLLSWIFFLGLACTSEGQKSANSANNSQNKTAENLDINIELKNVPEGPAFLIGNYQGQNFRVDSSNVDQSGTVVFKKEEPIPQGMYFAIFPDNSNIQLLIGQDQSMKITADNVDLFGTIKVKGNLNTELLYQNLNYESDYLPRINPINQGLQTTKQGTPEYESLSKQREALLSQRKARLQKLFDQYPNTFFTSFLKAGQNPDIQDVRNPDGTANDALQVFLYRTQFWDDVNFDEERLMYTPAIPNKLKRYTEQLTNQNADSIITSADYLINKVLGYPEYFKYFANYITLKYTPTKVPLMDAEKVYAHMIQNYFTRERAFWADSMTVFGLQRKAIEMSASVTGVKGPDVTAPGPDGQLHSISEIKSDYVIVYLYNPDCEHCMVETPKLRDFYKNWKSKGVEVYAIAIDTDNQKWKNYIKTKGLNWTNVFDPTNRSIYGKYYVDLTPEIYVLNKERVIIAKNIKVDQISTVIERDKE